MITRLACLLLLSFVLTLCKGEYYPDSPLARLGIPQQMLISESADTDTLLLNTNASNIAWKGTKMWGRGMHTGVVTVKEGYLLFRDRRLAGGYLTADMTSIGITDIPPDQPEPIRILTEHLEDEVFLDVSTYPEASFTFTNVRHHDNEELTVTGYLTIKDVRRQITVPAFADTSGRSFSTQFRLNRFDWNISYNGGFGATWLADRNFVDKHIELNIRLQVESSIKPALQSYSERTLQNLPFCLSERSEESPGNDLLL